MKIMRLIKTFATVLALLLVMLLAGTELWAQDFTNIATGKVTNKGNMKFKGSFINSATSVGGVTNSGTMNFVISTTGSFQNNVATPLSGGLVTNASGTIKFTGISATGNVLTGSTPLGSTVTERINGTVEYAGATAQKVYGVGNAVPTYYTNLTLDGGTKDIANAQHVSEIYTASGSGNRTYTGTFYYDGSIAQTIFGENGGSAGTNRYKNLDFSGGGTKNIITGASNIVYADGSLTSSLGTTTSSKNSFFIGQDASAGASTIAGAFYNDGTDAAFKNGTSDATFSGTVDLLNGGASGATFTMDNIGSVTFSGAVNIQSTGGTIDMTSSGSGLLTVNSSLTLANNADANLVLDAARRMNVSNGGSYVNSFDATGTNVTFNSSSIVDFKGAGQVIPATVSTNPYGNLYSTSSGSKTTNGDVYFAGNLSVNTGNLTFASGKTLFMQDLNKSVIYNDPANDASTDGASEVVGAMRLIGTTTGNQFATATPYRFNNHMMLVNFSAVTPSNPNYFEINSQPATNPNQYDNTRDVNRKITIAYDISAWTASITAGYKATDVPAQTPVGTWATTSFETNIRFWETKSGGTPNAEKVATGSAYTRNQGGTIHYVELAGITRTAADIDGTADAGFFSTNDLLLRAGPSVFVTKADGRWSNPGTWDEGVQPSSLDQAEIKHTVHVGFRRTSVDGGVAAGQRLESDYNGPDQTPLGGGNPNALIAGLTIDNVAGASLVFGKVTSAETDEANGDWTTNLLTTVTNLNTTAESFTNFDSSDLTTFIGNNPQHNGLLMLGSTNNVSFITNIFNNSGNIGIGATGTLQIGD